MTTDTNPSEAAMEIAREINSRFVKAYQLPGGLPLIELAELIDAGVGEMREALASMAGWTEYGVECDPWYWSSEQAPKHESDFHNAETALRAWRTK